MIPFHTNDSRKKHHALLLLREQTFFVVINQINKYKVKIYNRFHRNIHVYLKLLLKKFYFSNIKKFMFW